MWQKESISFLRILKKFGLEASQGLELLDHHLQSDYQSIVVILLDGMGKCIMDRNLENTFYNKNDNIKLYATKEQDHHSLIFIYRN